MFGHLIFSIMKSVMIVFCSVVMMTALHAFRKASRYADILQELGISMTEASKLFDASLRAGVLRLPGDPAFRTYPREKRAQAVVELGNLIRQYTKSENFANTFKALKEDAAPEGQAQNPDTVVGAQNNEERGNSLTALLGSVRVAPGRLVRKKLFKEKGIQDDEWIAALTQMQKPSDLVAYRLRQFLVLTQDIPFDATLVSNGGLMVFADPKLEQKDDDWKRCFRAGPETITAARQFAQEWLQELEGTK